MEKSTRMGRRVVLGGIGAAPLAALGVPSAGMAAEPDLVLGVLTDQTGPLADDSGAGSMLAARMAIADFAPSWPDRRIRLVGADHQNKPDVASSIARQWFDADGVAAIFDLANSAAALAVQGIAKEKSRVIVCTTSGASALTGANCAPTSFVWAYNNHTVSAAIASAFAGLGKKTWYFITADYAFGYSLEQEMRQVIATLGGTVVGATKHPLNTPDMSSYLLQAQASKADVIVLANGGADLVTTLKQAAEFGVSASGQIFATPLMFISAVHAIGLASAQGLRFASGYDWTLNAQTQGWADRFFAQQKSMPSQSQAAVYSAVTHFLTAAKAVGTTDGMAIAAQMRKLPVSDPFTPSGTIRPDGLLAHDMYVLEVKKPAESQSAWDLYKRVAIIPAVDADLPLKDSECSLAKAG